MSAGFCSFFVLLQLKVLYSSDSRPISKDGAGGATSAMMTRAAILLVGALGWAAALGLGDLADSPFPSEEPVTGPVAAAVLEVIDGDTIVVRARIWLGQAVETRVRLSWADAPEA